MSGEPAALISRRSASYVRSSSSSQKKLGTTVTCRPCMGLARTGLRASPNTTFRSGGAALGVKLCVLRPPFFFLPFACACFGASPGGLRWAWGFSS